MKSRSRTFRNPVYPYILPFLTLFVMSVISVAAAVINRTGQDSRSKAATEGVYPGICPQYMCTSSYSQCVSVGGIWYVMHCTTPGSYAAACTRCDGAETCASGSCKVPVPSVSPTPSISLTPTPTCAPVVTGGTNNEALAIGDSNTIASFSWASLRGYPKIARNGMKTTEMYGAVRVMCNPYGWKTAVVLGGVNNPSTAIAGLEGLYNQLRPKGYRIVGVTQYLYREYRDPATNKLLKPSADDLANLRKLNDWIRSHADSVIDLAADRTVTDANGFILKTNTQDGLHLTPAAQEYLSNRVAQSF